MADIPEQPEGQALQQPNMEVILQSLNDLAVQTAFVRNVPAFNNGNQIMEDLRSLKEDVRGLREAVAAINRRLTALEALEQGVAGLRQEVQGMEELIMNISRR